MSHSSWQYLKHVRPFKDVPIFERFPILICVTFVWIYAIILTASGAYRHKPSLTQLSCRTDKANLISTAPWYVYEQLLYCGLTFSIFSLLMSHQVQIPIPSPVGPSNVCSRPFVCYDVCGSCIHGRGINQADCG